MLSLRALAAPAAAVGLIAAVPSGALAAPSHHAQAHTAGGDATALIYPSIVQTRLVRAQGALDRAAKYADQGVPDKAIVALAAARNNLSKAWTGAKYVIQTTPPPPPAADKVAFHKRAFLKSGRLRIYKARGKRVHKADVVPPVGAVPATIYDTGFAVLSLQHYAATTAVSLIDDTSGTTLTGVRSTLSRSLNDRDAAIAYIHSIDVVAPPPVDDKVQAHSAGAPVGAAGWAGTMPNATVQLDDEIQQVEGTMAEAGLTGAQKSILAGADYRDIKTERTLNLYWPPLPVGAD
jgi:hypothetical protein